MDNTIDIRKLLEQSRDDVKTKIKEGAARTVKLDDLITAIGCAVKTYIQTILIMENHIPDPGRQLAVTMTTAGILMDVEAPEAFGLDKEDMFHFADIIYTTALFECGSRAGNPGEGAI